MNIVCAYGCYKLKPNILTNQIRCDSFDLNWFPVLVTFLVLCLVTVMAMKMSRKREASLRKHPEEMKRKIPSTVVSVSEDLTDLPAPVGTEEGCSSDEEGFYDADHDGALTSEDISAIYSDWINEMKRIDKQKITMHRDACCCMIIM